MRRIRTAAVTIPEYSVIPEEESELTKFLKAGSEPDLSKRALLEVDLHTLNGIERIMNEHRGEPMLFVQRRHNQPLLGVPYSNEGIVARKLGFVPTQGVGLYKPTPSDDRHVGTPEGISVNSTLVHVVQYGIGTNQRPWQEANFDFWFPYKGLESFSYDEQVIGSIPRSFGNNHTPAQLFIGRDEVSGYFLHMLGKAGMKLYADAVQALVTTGKVPDVPAILVARAA